MLQECATDSEELIYPIRAPSSCSAPPDLLLTSDRTRDTKVQPTTCTDAVSPERMLLEVRFAYFFDSISFSINSLQSNTIFPLKQKIKQEFTCDVSVEGGGKSTQPLQFSFTFYDLDGHHGKITKDVSLFSGNSSQAMIELTLKFCLFSGYCWYCIYDL